MREKIPGIVLMIIGTLAWIGLVVWVYENVGN